MFWLFIVALWTAMLLAPVLVLFLFLPSGHECPRCSAETVAVRSVFLRPVRRLAGRRWCIECGWEGIMRHSAWPRPLPRFEVVPDDGHDADGDAPWKGGGTPT
ncbi:MAG TPA: hypothetical protein VFX29_00165 [Longimicrobiaceae bacterium]|jgi:hypothetical protein|nr:hypothetical protein [Longimicrobiaceae bacterium]